MSNTIEQTLRDAWGTTPALAALVPNNKVFVGYPITRTNAGNITELTGPLVTIKEQAVNNVLRNNECEILTSLVRVAAFHRERDKAHAIISQVFDSWNRLEATYSRGKLMDLKPQTETETQDPDGSWHVALTLKALYSVTV